MQGKNNGVPDQLVKPAVRTFSTGMREITPGAAFEKIWHSLDKGYDIQLTHTYGFAMAFYSWLKKRLSDRIPVIDYPTSREQRRLLHQYQSKIWIRVKEHKALLKGAPDNPWLRDFYPDEHDFFITFSDFLGMNGARQWHEKGKTYKVLTHPLHPFYGVYFPTRESHLNLFDSWLKDNRGFERALDIGTGCGILSFIMHKHGLKAIHATDTNPNAIYSIQEDLSRLGMTSGSYIFPEQADMLGSYVPAHGDLIVCNPPWIPGKPLTTLDQGSYYEEDFFAGFFNTLKDRCPAGVKIAILFSNFALVAGITDTHPMEEALQMHHADFQLLLYDRTPVTDKPSRKKSWITSIRNKEHVELYVLERKET